MSESWPFGSGTEDDPYRTPPGFTPETTEAEMQEMLAEAEAEAAAPAPEAKPADQASGNVTP